MRTYRIGCFGAIRPFKNHLTQAFAAIKSVRQMNGYLKFYVNAGRCEQKGEPVLKNLRSLFAATPNAELVELPWLSHHEFRELLKIMDLSMSVSFTETFNIVTADAVLENVPVVVSPEVSWLPVGVQAPPTDVDAIVQRIGRILGGDTERKNRGCLDKYNDHASKVWTCYLSREH